MIGDSVSSLVGLIIYLAKQFLYTVFIWIEAGRLFPIMIFDPVCKCSPASIQTPRLFPIVHLSRVEWQVLCTSVYEFDNVVRGQHVYKSAWTPFYWQNTSVHPAGRQRTMINTL